MATLFKPNFGLMASQTDPNGVSTCYTYDPMGRPVQTQAMRKTAVVLYLLFAAFGFYGATGKEFFGGGVGKKALGNPVPKWFGRSWFIGFALLALYLGVRQLVGS